MRNTIVSDVASELHISKKTIYKYFKGGKEDALYYFFHKIAEVYKDEVENKLDNRDNYREKVAVLIREIIKQGKPYVQQNVADTDDYMVENQIVGQAFRDVYEDLLKNLIIGGIDSGEFEATNTRLMITFIYGMLLESMKIIHENPAVDIERDLIAAVLKLLSTA